MCTSYLRAVAVVCATVVVAVAAADSYAYGDYKKYNVREVTEKDLKCAGAPGKPYVHYVPCQEGYHCVEKDSYGSDEWGRYCLPVPKGYYDDKCYKTGEKCMGAAGKPYVEYLPCCTQGEVCKELLTYPAEYGVVKDDEWGSFCVPAGNDDKVPVYDVKEKAGYEYSHKFYDYKCHTTGFRCATADGFPYVDSGNGCCSSKEACVPDAYMGWGKFCKPLEKVYSDYEKYKEAPSEYKPPTHENEYWFEPPKSSYTPPAKPYNPYDPTPMESPSYYSQ
jgi:hypothetical protein